jgi:two-component system sensor histidine kinase UhpB
MLGRLRPIGLAEFGLAEALANLVEFWRRRNPEIAYRLDIAPDAEGFGELLDPTIYRVIQECLSNAMRHGRPTAVTVSLDRLGTGRDGEEEIVIRVADDGQGMATPAGIGYGLRGMSERIKALGGDLTISSPPGQGLTVTATLPCAGADARDTAERALAP